MAEDRDKAELITELAAARVRMGDNAQALRRDFAFAARAKTAFQRSPAPWLGGAAVLGLIVAQLSRRRKKIVAPKFHLHREKTVEKAGKAGLVLAAMKIGFDFARPILLKWLTQRFTGGRRAAPPPAQYR